MVIQEELITLRTVLHPTLRVQGLLQVVVAPDHLPAAAEEVLAGPAVVIIKRIFNAGNILNIFYTNVSCILLPYLNYTL